MGPPVLLKLLSPRFGFCLTAGHQSPRWSRFPLQTCLVYVGDERIRRNTEMSFFRMREAYIENSPISKTDIRIFAKNEQISSRSYVMRGNRFAGGTASGFQCACKVNALHVLLSALVYRRCHQDVGRPQVRLTPDHMEFFISRNALITSTGFSLLVAFRITGSYRLSAPLNFSPDTSDLTSTLINALYCCRKTSAPLPRLRELHWRALSSHLLIPNRELALGLLIVLRELLQIPDRVVLQHRDQELDILLRVLVSRLRGPTTCVSLSLSHSNSPNSWGFPPSQLSRSNSHILLYHPVGQPRSRSAPCAFPPGCLRRSGRILPPVSA